MYYASDNITAQQMLVEVFKNAALVMCMAKCLMYVILVTCRKAETQWNLKIFFLKKQARQACDWLETTEPKHHKALIVWSPRMCTLYNALDMACLQSTWLQADTSVY